MLADQVPAMINTKGLNHLALPVRDPQRSAAFYTEFFNLEITSSSPEAVFLKTAGSRDMIALSRSESPVESARNRMHFGFMVDPEQFDAALRTIEEKSIRLSSEPGERSIGRFVFIEDPDGYIVEIFECLSPPYV